VHTSNRRVVFIDGTGVGGKREISSDMAMIVGGGALQSKVATDDCGCNDGDELGELVNVVGSAHRRKYVVPHSVVRIEECFPMPPRALDRVRMSERRRTCGTNRSLNSLLKP
jgi:hypothetical protein